eukprot:5222958-Prymnesium_polylepis.1
MYTSLLWVRRKAYLKDIPTRLSCATEFLTGDYKRQAFLWEPLEMCRKLLLSKSCRSISHGLSKGRASARARGAVDQLSVPGGAPLVEAKSE